MTGRPRLVGLVAGLAVVAILLGTAWAVSNLGGMAPSPSATPGLPGLPASPVRGVVTGVDATGLTEVQTFTLRADDGRSWEFRVGDLENPTEFPESHLAEHQATTVPVRVYFTFDGSELVAHRIEDAE